MPKTAPRAPAPKARADVTYAVEMRPIEKILPYTTNPMIHTPENVAKLARIIERVGQLVPIVVDKVGVIAKGHRTRLAMIQLGYTKAAVHVARDVPPKVLRQWRLDDNRVARDTAWDEALLRSELGELRSDGVDLSMTAFNADELGKLFSDPTNGSGSGPGGGAGDEQFLCVVTCTSEAQLKGLYEELTRRAFACKLVT